MDYDTLVCTVSDQPLPNLLPAIAASTGRENIILLVSPRMQHKADILEAALRAHGKRTTRQEVDDTGDIKRYREQIQRLVQNHPRAILNATGGTKLMSLIATEIFRDAQRPIFYCERDNRIIWINPSEKPQDTLPGLLDLPGYFSAFGENITSSHSTPLNKKDGPHNLKKLAPPRPQDNHQQADKQFESNIFATAKQALEQRAPQGKHDVRWNVTIQGAVRDEYDIVILLRNTLYLIECKNTGKTDTFNAFLNKLEALKQKHGITARAALVTTATLPANGGHRDRANATGIRLFDNSDLPHLLQKFTQWFYG